eukprot:289475_1
MGNCCSKVVVSKDYSNRSWETDEYIANLRNYSEPTERLPLAGKQLKGIKVPSIEGDVKLRVRKTISNSLQVDVLTYNETYNRRYVYKKHTNVLTLLHFLKHWEYEFGASMRKISSLEGIIPNAKQKFFDSVLRAGAAKNNIDTSTKLIDLLNIDIDWHTFTPGLQNNPVENVIFDTNVYRFDPGKIIKLDKLLNNNDTQSDEESKFDAEYSDFKYCVENRGWVLIEFPEHIQQELIEHTNKIQCVLNKYFEYTNSASNGTNNEFKSLCDCIGFNNFKDYKSLLTILTGDMFKRFEDIYPNDILKSIEILSNIMDTLANDILNKTKLFWIGLDGNDYYKYKHNKDIQKKQADMLKKSDTKIFPELCLYNDNKLECGMIDFVIYKNNKESKDNKYEMLENELNVDSHIDAGLFSISWIQNNEGIQLLDKNLTQYTESLKWINLPVYNDGKYGILWTGQYANKLSNKNIATGVHRVVYNHNKPRFTAWYEACVNNQIPKEIWDKAKI